MVVALQLRRSVAVSLVEVVQIRGVDPFRWPVLYNKCVRAETVAQAETIRDCESPGACQTCDVRTMCEQSVLARGERFEASRREMRVVPTANETVLSHGSLYV